MHRYRIVMVIGMGLYVLSLALPAFVAGGTDLLGHSQQHEVIYGFQCLAMGFFVLPGWVANPLVLIGAPLLSVGFRRAPIALLSLALASAVIAPFLLMGVDLVRLDHLSIGYYVWLASIVALLVAALAAPDRVKAPVSRTASWPSRIPPR